MGVDKLNEAIELLSHPRSAKRTSGAKRLRKLSDPQAGPALEAALRKEMRDPRTWEPKFCMILAIGDCCYREALPLLEELAEYDFEATILYDALGDAIVRLSHRDLRDAEPVLRFLNGQNDILAGGALHALATLRIVPAEDVIKQIIAYAGHLGFEGEPRMWAAVAAAGWKRELTGDFLRECQAAPPTASPRLVPAATAALKGKYYNFATL
jgi:hypothetical protein